MKRTLLIFFVFLNLLIAQSLFSPNRTFAETTCCIGNVDGVSCVSAAQTANYQKIVCNNLGGSCNWTCTGTVNTAGCTTPSGSPLSCDSSGNAYSCNNSSGVPQYCCGSSSVCTNIGFTPVSVGNTNPTAPVPAVVFGKWYSPTVAEFYAKVYGSPDQEIFGERYTFAQVVWIINSISLLFQFDITSQESIEAIQGLFGQRIQPSMYSMATFGPMGVLIGSMADMYSHPPASGVSYIADGLKKFNIVSPAFAQGYGYTNTEIVRPLWTASRNVSYFLMVILLIAAGFMIMFRVKVNAQTAVSIQVMIPKIIITLILITFSYAIGGLIIDLIYLVLTLIISMLSTQGVVNQLGNAVKFFTEGMGSIILYFMANVLIFQKTIGQLLNLLGGAGTIISLVITIVLLVLLARVWWMLVKTYISMLLGFILAPWQILLGLIPGSKGGFGSWLKSMIADASVFVIVPLMFLLSFYLNRYTIQDLVNFLATDFGLPLNWLPTFLNPGLDSPSFGDNATPTLPMLGGMATGMYFVASLAILALIPKAAEAIKKALSVATFAYGSAFGEPLSSGAHAISSDTGYAVAGTIGKTFGGAAGATRAQDITEKTAGFMNWVGGQTKK